MTGEKAKTFSLNFETNFLFKDTYDIWAYLGHKGLSFHAKMVFLNIELRF